MKTIKVRTAKQKIKEDELANFLSNAEEWINKYWRFGTYVLAGIAVIVIVFLFVSASKRNAEKDAGYELANTKQFLNRAEYDNAIQGLSKIMKNYRGTFVAKEAELLLGRVYVIEGKPDSAEIIFRNYLKNNSEKDLLGIAATNGLATSLESKKLFKESYELYMNVYHLSPTGVMAPQALLDAARVALFDNQSDKAKSAALQLVQSFPSSTLKAQAEEILQRTGK